MSEQAPARPNVEWPEPGEYEKQKQLRAAHERAVVEGDRMNAANLQGELLSLRPINFPESASPARVWSTARLSYEPSPYRAYNGNASEFLAPEVEEVLKAQADHPEISKYLLELASVDPGTEVYTPDSALDAYRARRLSDEVGTYRKDEEAGGISYCTPDGHLQSFVWPRDPARQEAMETSLKEAGFDLKTLIHATLSLFQLREVESIMTSFLSRLNVNRA